MIRTRADRIRRHRPRIATTVPARLAIWCTSIFAVWQGAWILLSGPERWSGPSYAILRELPLSPGIWGTWAGTAGLLIAFGSALDAWQYHWHVRAFGLLALSIWAACFSAGTLAAAVTIPTAGTTGAPSYLFISFLVAILIGYDDSPDRSGRWQPVPGTTPRR